MALHFTSDEYANRLSKTRTAMDAAGLDVLIVSDPSNMAWLTGYNGWSFYVHQAVIVGTGFDPIWFGIVVVMTVELGLITPPVGLNVFVINSVARDVSLVTIFKGVLPFVLADIIRLILLISIAYLVCTVADIFWLQA